ncbi:hypothetical protein J6500_31280, partial [Bradyrhizobium sp. WSM 1704]|uniref:Ig-like domain-containing protein n=1 Tax=Bradyrhizobium semiaridum TaxID=2821404 RepID=UPI001CE28917
DLDRSTFNDHNNTGTVTFTFSEVPSGFDLADVSVTGGGLSNLQPVVGNPLQYTATFTADDNSTTAVAISVAADKFTDPVGNDNLASNTDTATVDTQNPTVVVEIADASLSDGDNSSNVTFTFSEAPVGFTAADISATHGTVSNLAATADPLVFTATFTAADGFTGNGSVSVTAGSYTDVAGNLGSTGADTVAIDTQNPTVVVEIADASLSDGHNSSNVTFTFSEAVSAATVATLAGGAGITVAGGTLSALSWAADHTSATATFTATDG